NCDLRKHNPSFGPRSFDLFLWRRRCARLLAHGGGNAAVHICPVARLPSGWRRVQSSATCGARMIGRRDLLIGGACVVAAGAAYTLTPRKRLILLKETSLAEALPMSFAGWSAESADGLVQPVTEGALATQLYSEMVGRIYRQAATGQAIMMLVAYGD